MAMIVRAAGGVPGVPDGFPILFDDDMAIIEAAFAYLIEHATVLGRSHAAETVRTYAEHLHDWFDSLEQSGIDWRTADEMTVAAYRNRMLEAPSSHTRRPYARSTINDRVRTVCRFYEWAHRRGLVEELPFRFVDVRSTGNRRERGMLAHLDRQPQTKMTANALTVCRTRSALSAHGGMGSRHGAAPDGAVRLQGLADTGYCQPRRQRGPADWRLPYHHPRATGRAPSIRRSA